MAHAAGHPREQVISRAEDPADLATILDLITQVAEPDPRDELLRALFAQQDATDVSRRATETPETGTVMDFLASLGELALDLSPGAGDVKAAAFDAPEQFGEGRNLAGIISVLSAIPGVGLLGDLARGAGRGIGRGASEIGTILDNIAGARSGVARGELRGTNAIDELLSLGRGGGGTPAPAIDEEGIRIFEDLLQRQGASPAGAEMRARSTATGLNERAINDILAETGGEPGADAFERLIARLGGTGGTQRAAGRAAPTTPLDDIRAQIFESLRRTDDETAAAELTIEQLLELARRRSQR